VRSPIRSVALNALFLDPGVSGGPETYLRQLAPALASEYPGTRFTVVTTRRGAAALERDGWRAQVELLTLPVDEGQRLRRTLAEQALLPRLARRRGWDVVHSLATVAPIRAGAPSVITLHDVTFFRHRTFGLLTTVGMRQITARAARRASALITAASSVRDEICSVLGLDPSAFSIVPHGVGRPADVEPAPEPEVRQRHALGDSRVVLCVAAKRPHKNQELLIRALPQLPNDVVLVLAGHPEPYEQRLRELAQECGVAARVRFPGYVPDDELEALWRLAGCFAFPTLAEGFGLPVLEAMQRAVPVACSDIPVLREVCGDAVCYFDPHDPGSAAGSILAALDDDALRAGGRERASRYSWRDAARGTFEAYERALRSRA
jgi:glycosyltransferase involved in cell wall biosynthesis